MIRHVVLLTWTAEATGEQKQAMADELRALPPKMTGMAAYHVGPDARIVDGNADFAIVADFDDAASYLAYREHPDHRAVIEQFVLPIAAQRVSVQYEI
jgi:ABC-type sulfate transport system substrate-binding protein